MRGTQLCPCARWYIRTNIWASVRCDLRPLGLGWCLEFGLYIGFSRKPADQNVVHTCVEEKTQRENRGKRLKYVMWEGLS
jgi:hypothetical protein